MRGWWSPGTSTGMTAVQSLSFAQHKSEQNKIAIAKAGYHYGSGILPFVLYGAFGGNRCVRTYAGKWQNFTISGCSFMGECGILGLVQQIGICNGGIYMKEIKIELLGIAIILYCLLSK